MPEVTDSPAGARILGRRADRPLLGWLRRDAASSVKFEGSAVPSQQRDLRLDFFRGLALIFIFIDHIPENILSYFTLQAFQFYDAAEVFIFISGYTAALVYSRTLALQGPLYATAQILRRAWQLYIAHIFLFMIFIAEVSYTATTFNNPMYNDEMRVADFLEEPHVAIIKALLLEFQPTFLDILPLYILLLVIFPVILLGLRLQPLLVLIPSFLLYVVVQVVDRSRSGLSGRACLVFQPPRLAISVYGGGRSRFRRDSHRATVAPRGRAPADGDYRRCSGVYHQAQLDDPRGLGRCSRPFLEGTMAGQQEQSIANPARPVLCHRVCRRLFGDT